MAQAELLLIYLLKVMIFKYFSSGNLSFPEAHPTQNLQGHPGEGCAENGDLRGVPARKMGLPQ